MSHVRVSHVRDHVTHACKYDALPVCFSTCPDWEKKHLHSRCGCWTGEQCVRVAWQVLRRAFRYHWRLWTLPELREMLLAAGFNDVRLPRPLYLPSLQAILTRNAFTKTLSLRPNTDMLSTCVGAEALLNRHVNTACEGVAAARPHP